jgi:hypothetical protein
MFEKISTGRNNLKVTLFISLKVEVLIRRTFLKPNPISSFVKSGKTTRNEVVKYSILTNLGFWAGVLG